MSTASDVLARIKGASSKPADVEQREYWLQLITPMYGGGASPGWVNSAHPFRGSELRHALRFWWRLLAQVGQLPAQTVSWNGEDLYEKERWRFGGLREDGSAEPSRVRVRIEVQWQTIHAHEQYWEGMPMYVRGLLNLWKRGVLIEGAPGLLAAGATARLAIATHSNDAEAASWHDEMEMALRWWASFGGIGARTRRGMGSVAVERILDGSRAPLRCVTASEASAAGCWLLVHGASPPASPPFSRAQDAWDFVIGAYQHFRQGPDARRIGKLRKKNANFRRAVELDDAAAKERELLRIYRAPSHPFSFDQHVRPLNNFPTDGGYRPGRNKWPEPNTLRGWIHAKLIAQDPTDYRACEPHIGGYGWLPRATFGLPIDGDRLET